MKPSQKYHIRYFHYKHTIAFLKQLGNEGKNKLKVLDIGCGRGELTQCISTSIPNLKMTGCDISIKYISYFNKYLRIPSITTQICNAEKLPFPDKSFDVVIIFDVLEHINQPGKAIAEARRVLKPHGVFHLVVPCEGDIFTIDGWIKRFFSLNIKEKPIGHIQQFSHKEIILMLKKEKFLIQEKYFSYFIIYQILSLIYYLFTYFNNGKYIELIEREKSTLLSSIMEYCIFIGGWIVYTETAIYSRIPFIRGQTVHILSRRN